MAKDSQLDVTVKQEPKAFALDISEVSLVKSALEVQVHSLKRRVTQEADVDVKSALEKRLNATVTLMARF